VTRVLFVCTGNICRSPTAHGVLRDLVREAGLEYSVAVDSAGTHDFHVGESPDRRAQAHAARRGYDLSQLKARQVGPADFRQFDLILAMDRGHLLRLERDCPPEEHHKLRLFTDYVEGRTGDDVPDPYYGGSEGFERALDMIESGARGLLGEIQRRHR
jgi:protein-tyrosine phosphatase